MHGQVHDQFLGPASAAVSVSVSVSGSAGSDHIAGIRTRPVLWLMGRPVLIPPLDGADDCDQDGVEATKGSVGVAVGGTGIGTERLT